MTYELRHLQKRKHDEKLFDKEHTHLKKILDRFAYPVAVLGPLSSIAQVLEIWNQRSAEGVSPVVWIVLLCTSTFWMFYGIIHKERVIFFGHMVWFCFSLIILCEIILFS